MTLNKGVSLRVDSASEILSFVEKTIIRVNVWVIYTKLENKNDWR